MEGDHDARNPQQNGVQMENGSHQEPEPPPQEPGHQEEHGEPAAWDGGALSEEPSAEHQHLAPETTPDDNGASTIHPDDEPTAAAPEERAAPPDGSEARRRRQLAQLARMRSARANAARSHRRELSKLN